MNNNSLQTNDEILELFGALPEPLLFDESMYELDLSAIISSI